jgi:hypothetical protein
MLIVSCRRSRRGGSAFLDHSVAPVLIGRRRDVIY